MAMEDNELKEKVRNKIHQKIAIANIRKEFARKRTNGKRIIYGISSVCAVVILGIGVYMGTGLNKEKQAEYSGITNLAQGKENKEETQKIEWKINRVKENITGDFRIDADIQTVQQGSLPDKFSWLTQGSIPEGYGKEECYAIYTKQSLEETEYNILKDYVVTYEKDYEHFIRIAFSEKGEPVRDYFISGKQVSKIGEQELVISKRNEMYIVTFQKGEIYVDIETVGITEEELKDLLISLIENSRETEQKAIYEGEDNTEEPAKTVDSSFPEYYAGKYVDSKGKNVVLLCQDNSANRKEICKILGITESKTIFQTATYSYNYLLDLQNKISDKMMKKEFTFVTTSALLEDRNKIRVTVRTENEEELQKLKALDTKGGALEIEFVANGITIEELLKEKE